MRYYRLIKETKMFQRLITSANMSNGKTPIAPRGTLVYAYKDCEDSSRIFIKIVSGEFEGFVRNSYREELARVSPLELLARTAE